MQILTKFNRKNIDDRKIDTLIGLSKGLSADAKVNQAEADFLLGWLIQSRACSDHPIIINLLDKVESMLGDGFLDDGESEELLSLLQNISGESSEIGELAKTTSLPLCNPVPPIEFPGKTFLFTGTFAYGTRKKCHAVTEKLGATYSTRVTKSVDYLVLGTYVTDSWKHENCGTKILKAQKYRYDGVPLSIISESHWAISANLE